jgi:hypothetical protein
VKAPSPLLGFNNNVRHKGRLFHIQTEDSGIRHPHIITHLFADGGRILKTTKTSYAEHVGQATLAETVRELMKEQHKAMFIALRDGHFDYLFDETAAPPAGVISQGEPSKPGRATAPSSPEVASAPKPQAQPPRPAAPAADAAPRPKPPVAAAAASPPRPSAPATRPASVSSSAAQAARPSPVDAPPPPSKRTTSRPRLDIDAALHGLGSGGRSASSPSSKAMRAPAPPEIEAEPSIDLDLDALERAAAEAQTPFFQQIQDLPPPPASVIGRRAEAAAMGVGVYSNVHQEHPIVVSPPLVAEQLSGGPGSGRYAPPRPASIFATNRPAEGASIFGEDLISEKSLDEVILSYLAEDLDSPAEKK